MMDIKKADDLAALVTTVGLIQNLGALRALTTDGIVRGHMDLHKNNIIAATDATPEERVLLNMGLQDLLIQEGSISESDAHRLLNELRSHS